jgi:two-component system chemotaxis response regulator CheY
MAKILIADDSETLRQQLNEDLQSDGHDVTQAEDGQQAYERMQGGENFELMIFDINMPGMSGLDALEKRKKKSLQNDAIVFLLTTDSTPELKIRAKELGVKAWITKPYQKESLLSVIRKVFPS